MLNKKIIFPGIVLLLVTGSLLAEQVMIDVNIIASSQADAALKSLIQKKRQELDEINITTYGDYDIRAFIKDVEQAVKEVLGHAVRVDEGAFAQKYNTKSVPLHALLDYSLDDVGIASAKKVDIEVM